MEDNDLFKGLESFLTSSDAIDEGLIVSTPEPVEVETPKKDERTNTIMGVVTIKAAPIIGEV